ncbi:Yip1-domain-containing protein [Martensiomyces pterosporus]|nr:Yip1-domain-containing protein [Martensiomyces pterosporus]
MSYGRPNNDYNIVVDVDEDEPTLEFQDFATAPNMQQGRMNTSGSAPPYQPPASTGGGGEADTGSYSVWHVEYWARYFNVDSRDVVQRVFLAVVPKDSFLDVYNANPDLWGTFWIPTSVVFAMFVTASLSQSIAKILAGGKREYDFTMLSFATFTVYSYVLTVGAFVYLATKYFGSQPGLMECLSVYGYAMAVWIPISILCVLPLDWFRWAVVAVGFVSSGFFIMRSVNQIVGRSNGKLHKAIIPLLLVAHALLVIVFKFKFFSYTVASVSPTSPGQPSTPAATPTPTPTSH